MEGGREEKGKGEMKGEDEEGERKGRDRVRRGEERKQYLHSAAALIRSTATLKVHHSSSSNSTE